LGLQTPLVTKSAFSRRHDQFRKILAQARQDAGLTQVALAKKLDRPQSFVSKFELGERRLDVIEFLDIARALSIDPAKVIADLDRR
jgi:transcriptional regulator with XRE-family HTH domain